MLRVRAVLEIWTTTCAMALPKSRTAQVDVDPQGAKCSDQIERLGTGVICNVMKSFPTWYTGRRQLVVGKKFCGS
jgi:hypothetical protein